MAIIEYGELLINMSKRLTSEWTKTTKEAYGDTPFTQKGLRAEKLILEYLKRVYDEVTWYENDRDKQVAGIDFEFKKNSWVNYYTADVKANLNKGRFYVFPEEMKRKKNHRMIHVDLDEGWVVEYDRKEMLNYLTSLTNSLVIDGKKCFRFDVWSIKQDKKINFFRTFNLKNSNTNKNRLSKVLEKYEPVGF